MSSRTSIAPLPIVEVASTASAAPLVALLFAAVGASLGSLVGRAARVATTNARIH